MLDLLLRKLKDKVLEPIGLLLGKVFSPNTLTLFSFILGLGAIFFLYIQNLSLALTFWILNRIFDGLDGSVARLYNRQTDFGGYLDILLDFIIYAGIPIIIIIKYPTTFNFIALSIMLGIYYLNGVSWMYLSSILEKRKQGAKETKEQTSVTMPGGIVGGTETIVFYILFIVLPQYIAILFYIFSGLIFITIIQRFLWAVKHIK
jgi:phosphatidylglycerophosphate synthase